MMINQKVSLCCNCDWQSLTYIWTHYAGSLYGFLGNLYSCFVMRRRPVQVYCVSCILVKIWCLGLCLGLRFLRSRSRSRKGWSWSRRAWSRSRSWSRMVRSRSWSRSRTLRPRLHHCYVAPLTKMLLLTGSLIKEFVFVVVGGFCFVLFFEIVYSRVYTWYQLIIIRL